MADPAVAARDLPGRGIGLVATRPIAAGEILVREAPILLVPEGAAAPAVCAACLCYLPAGGVTTPCTACRRVAFCSHACASTARSAPAWHTPAHCAALAAADDRGLGPDGATSLRFAVAAAALQAAAAAGGDPAAAAAWAAFERLAAPAGLQTVAATAGAVGSRLDAALAAAVPGWVVPAPVLAAWLAREAANAFGVLAAPDPADPAARAVRGSGLYAISSRFNHDCLPCAARFDGFDDPSAAAGPARTVLEVRALHAIPRGEEVMLSYFPLDWPYEDRAGRLVEEYGFACSCARCALEASGARPSDESMMGGGGAGGGAASVGMSSSARQTTSAGSALMSEGGPVASCATTAAAAATPPADPAYVGAFLAKFCCGHCSGTMAPLRPGDGEGDHVCNVCGSVRSHANFLKQLEEGDWDEEEEEEEGMDE